MDEYKKHGIPIWALTTQNEPTTGFVKDYPFNTMGMTPKEQVKSEIVIVH